MKTLILYIMATFIVGCNITIGDYKFTQANKIKVKKSFKDLLDTADITLPLLKGKINADRVHETLATKIKEGDAVQIYMSYTDPYTQRKWEYKEFDGYVHRVSPDVPMLIECHNDTYWLRKTNLVKTFKNTTLKELVQYIVSEANKKSKVTITLSSKIPDVNIDTFRMNNVTADQAIQTLKDEYGLVAYFRGHVLFVGLAFTDVLTNVNYSFAHNIKPKHSLTYRTLEQHRVKMKAVAILKDNKNIKVEVGADDGEVITKFYYNIKDEATLKKIAEADLTKLRYEGFEGSFKTYYIPYVEHSMGAVLADPEMEAKPGTYLTESVETEWNANSIERTVHIGKRLS